MVGRRSFTKEAWLNLAAANLVTRVYSFHKIISLAVQTVLVSTVLSFLGLPPPFYIFLCGNTVSHTYPDFHIIWHPKKRPSTILWTFLFCFFEKTHHPLAAGSHVSPHFTPGPRRRRLAHKAFGKVPVRSTRFVPSCLAAPARWWPIAAARRTTGISGCFFVSMFFFNGRSNWMHSPPPEIAGLMKGIF